MGQPESSLPAFLLRMVTFHFAKIYRYMTTSKGLILVDVLIVIGAILVAVHLFKLSRGVHSPSVHDPLNSTEQTELKPNTPDFGE